MASNGVDPVEGYPLFPELDAPQLGADYEEVAAWAAWRGNMPIGPVVERDAWGYAKEGSLWSNTTSKTVDYYTGSGWATLWAPAAAGTATVGAGWSTPSQNSLTRHNGNVWLTFNAIRSANASSGALIVAIPEGFRTNRNIYGQSWGVAGATAAIQVNYDGNTHQVRLGQALVSGQGIAFTLSWPVTG